MAVVRAPAPVPPVIAAAAKRCRRKFLGYYPGGFDDGDYLDLERDYKWNAHLEWLRKLGPGEYRLLLKRGRPAEIAAEAVRIESRTNLLFSFEKMAVRDAVRTAAGARLFSEGLYDFLYGGGRGRAGDERRFEAWRDAVAALPRRETRVLTWPVLTVFAFLARPEAHVFLKPMVTRRAAEAYGFDFRYRSRPGWETYGSLLEFARRLKRDLKDLRPKDMMDVQGFIWVMGSDEYP